MADLYKGHMYLNESRHGYEIIFEISELVVELIETLLPDDKLCGLQSVIFEYHENMFLLQYSRRLTNEMMIYFMIKFRV